MVYTRPSRWLSTTVQLLGLLSTAEAVTLSQFQPIAPNILPNNCLAVYNSAINGCVESDFVSNAVCSARCMQGLKSKESQVQVFCGNIQVNPRSLIGIAIKGELLRLLCPGQTVPTGVPGFGTIPATTATSTRAPAEPTTTITTRTSQPTTVPKPPQPTEVTSSEPQQSSPALVPPPSTTRNTSTSTTNVATTELPAPTTTSARTTTSGGAVPTPVNPPADPPVDSDNDDDTAGPQAIEQNGSPFANINNISAGHPVYAPATWSMVLATLFAGMLLGA
ncbi:CD68 antigen [Microdochium nivale]|nr:CD68 antigen [Microdochium nivale]